jgi:hypothetical protein
MNAKKSSRCFMAVTVIGGTSSTQTMQGMQVTEAVAAGLAATRNAIS